MRIFLISLIFSTQVMASTYSQYPQPQAVPSDGEIDASVNNIPISFAETAGSKIISGISLKGHKNILCNNKTGSDLYVAVSDSAAGITYKFNLPAGAYVEKNDYPLATNVYLRSNTGLVVSAQKVSCDVW